MKYGFYRVCITPKAGTGLAGFTRKPTSDGVYDDLYLQMLLLEDDSKRRLLLLSMDLIGLDLEFVAKMRRWMVGQDKRLTPEAINFSATHTHCGPTTCIFIPEAGVKSPAYLKFLETCMKDGLRHILREELKPATLWCGIGTCGLGLNRRKLTEIERDGKKEMYYAMRPNFEGPVDHSLGVLMVKGKDREIMMVNYACHPSARGGYRVSCDYPGAAMRVLRAQVYPHREAMFLQGGCGDCRVPCLNEDKTGFKGGSSEDVIEYGNRVVAAVDKVMKKGLTKISPRFSAGRSTFVLPYNKDVQLLDAKANAGYRRLANWRLKHQNPDGVPMEWVVWRLSKECVMSALPGEVCHGIGVWAKKLSTAKYPFFMGYTNGCPCYIPTDRIIEEGGYEGRDSMPVYAHAHPFKVGSEGVLREKFEEAMAKAGRRAEEAER